MVKIDKTLKFVDEKLDGAMADKIQNLEINDEQVAGDMDTRPPQGIDYTDMHFLVFIIALQRNTTVYVLFCRNNG